MKLHLKITKKQIEWGLLLLLVIGLLIALLLYLRAGGELELFFNQELLREYIAGFGIWAPLIFVGLQILQVLLSVIPGAVTTIVGGALFGFWPSFLMSCFAIFVGSMLAFGLAKLLGRPIVRNIVGKDVYDKYFSAVSSRSKITLILMLLFPYFPDDLLCLLAGSTGIRPLRFLLMLVLTRPWGLLFSALLGSGMLTIPLWLMIVIGVVSVAAGIVLIKNGPKVEAFFIGTIKRLTKRIAHTEE